MYSDSLPRLLPLWHDVTINEERGKKLKTSFDKYLYPDHGGAGVDVSVINEIAKCEELKVTTNYVNYGADMPALPYLPPNKVKSLFDPCLGRLQKRRKRQQEFCRSLEACRNTMKKPYAFRKAVSSAHEEIACLAEGSTLETPIPEAVMKLAKLLPTKNFPADLARWEYLGGCLTSLTRSSSSHLLLHPVGAKLSILAVTPLQESANSKKLLEADTKIQLKIPVKGGKIFQICADSNSGACCVRKRRNYHYISFTDFKTENFKDYVKVSYSYDEPISCINLNPFVPAEHILALKSGKLFLKNAELKKPVWTFETPSHSSVDSWWNCDFGSHPRSVLYSDRQSLCCLDLRTKGMKTVSLFSTSSPFVTKGEMLTVTRKLDSSPFQHFVASDFHLFICDERYPKQPVMSWNHMLESPPLYCDVKKFQCQGDTSEYVALLASQETSDISSFHFNCKTSRIQPQSLSQPLHLSSPDDHVHMLKSDSVYVNDTIEQRLSLPLVGVCAIPYSNSNGYMVLQATSVGDVFYQQFRSTVPAEKCYRFGPGCPTVSSEDILPHISSWMKRTKKMCKLKEKESVPYVCVDKSVFLNSSSEKYKLSDCKICQCETNIPTLNDSELNVCPYCGVHVEYGEQLMQCANEGGVLGGRFHLNDSSCQAKVCDFPTLDLTQFCDPLSSRMLNVWGSTNIENEITTLDQSSYIGDVSFGEGVSATLDRRKTPQVTFSLETLEKPIESKSDSQWSTEDAAISCQKTISRKATKKPSRSSSLGF